MCIIITMKFIVITYMSGASKSRKTDGFMAFVAAVTLADELPDEMELSFFNPIIL